MSVQSSAASPIHGHATTMIKTRNDQAPSVRQKVADLLNDRLADGLNLQLQLKQAHWNIKGPDFIQIHELFDTVWQHVVDHNDEMAERIAQIGGLVEGTVEVIAKKTELKRYPTGVTAGHEHVVNVANALASFAEEIRHAIDAAHDAGDAVTTDLLTKVCGELDKDLWFVEAHLQAKS